MNTLTKMFSLCLCFGALVFASPDIKLSGDLIDANELGLIGKVKTNETSSRGVCDESFAVMGYGDLNGNGSVDLCYTDGTGFYNFTWDGGCLATMISYSGGDLDLSSYGFTEGFFFYGFEGGATEEFVIMFDDGTAAAMEATSLCGTSCSDNGWVDCFDGGCAVSEEDCPVEGECQDGYVLDCVDSDCCPESWIGDGFEDCEDQAYGCDLTCYDNDGGDCDNATGGTTGGTTGGGSSDCESCVNDYTAYGSECCDTAWDEYGIDCATLESNYGWDCTGCACPGDSGETTGGTTGGGGCGAGEVEDCDGSGECWPESWIADGFPDCNDQQYGADLTCYDCDGGDCPADDPGCTSCEDSGQVDCWDGSCADTADDCPEQPSVETPGICAEGTVLYDAPAVSVTWSIETVCGDGVCNGDEDYYNCPEDCNAPGECDEGFVPDCVDDDCCPESWIGDGFEDCEDQAYGCDLTCYDNDGGDCGAGTDGGGTDGGGTTGGGSESCEDCEFDWTAYGSECCDTAWDEYGIDCATLESNYGWDCAGCSCPGDGPAECGDGNCTGDETYESCPEDCLPPGECPDGQVLDCDGTDECWPESWIGDGFGDCEDQQYGADLTCYDNDGGDCDGRESATGYRSIVNVPSSIESTSLEVKKGAPYSRTAASSPFHGAFENTSSRDLVMNLTFEVLEGTNAGFVNTWAADPALGEFTVYGFGADDFVCVTAQACDGGACGDVLGPVCVLAGALDGVQECVEGAGGDPCDGTAPGDANLDSEINVLDIVQIVNHILESALLTDECAIGAADYTADGEVNVLDIVQIVNVILEGRTTGDASSALLKNENGRMLIEADGYIGGVQMTLSHSADFSIEVTDKALVADYNTMGNITKLVIVAPETDELFSSVGNFTIDEMIVANSTSEVTVTMPSSVEFVGAYPNPFNPSTTLSLNVAEASAATIMAYDITGRVVDVVFDGTLQAGMSTITWNASSLPSGVYIVKLSTPEGAASMQKVMLMK